MPEQPRVSLKLPPAVAARLEAVRLRLQWKNQPRVASWKAVDFLLTYKEVTSGIPPAPATAPLSPDLGEGEG